MTRIANGRIHLSTGAKLRIGAGGREGEVVRGHLDGGDVLAGSKQRDFVCGRKMENMNTLAGYLRQAQQPLCRQTRCLGITPEGMTRGIVLPLESFSPVQARFVFRMKYGTAGDAGQNCLQIVLAVEEEVAGR